MSLRVSLSHGIGANYRSFTTLQFIPHFKYFLDLFGIRCNVSPLAQENRSLLWRKTAVKVSLGTQWDCHISAKIQKGKSIYRWNDVRPCFSWILWNIKFPLGRNFREFCSLPKNCKFIIPQTYFPLLGLLYHVSKIRKSFCPRKVQNRQFQILQPQIFHVLK